MSSRTPEECVTLATDESATAEQREDAIHELKMANECDELAKLVRTDGLDDRYRQQALRTLATPQCEATLDDLTEDEALDRSLRQEATNLLQETETDT